MILSFGFKQDVWDLVDCLGGHIKLSDLAAKAQIVLQPVPLQFKIKSSAPVVNKSDYIHL